MASGRELDDETLMRYLDGDLGRDEARDAERLVAASPELRAKAAALAQLREVMIARTQAAEDEVEARLEAMWDRIGAGIAAAPAPARARTSFWAGVRDWFEAYRGHLVTGTLAAAAGAIIALAVGGRARVVEKVVHEQPPAPTAVAAAAEVESLDVPDGSAALLQIPADRPGEAATTVIWITPNEDEGPI